MEKVTVCLYPQSDHALPQCKCVMLWCAKFPSVNIPNQETDDQYYNTSLSIRFHVYHLIVLCTTHGRLMLTNKNNCCKCKQYSVSEQPTKMYTRKGLVMMETTISNFHTSFYIIEIQKLAFHLPYVQILDTSHCGDSSPNCV